MTQLRLKFLGQPEVRHQGQVLKFRSRKVLALLTYLVVEGGRHSREKLIDLLWPDSDHEQGQASLRNTVARLRQALGEAESYLAIDKDSAGFDFARPFDLDLNVIQRAGQITRETTRLADASALQTAVVAYAGEFLDGFSLSDAPDFDHWASQQREAWHQRLERICNRLSRWQFEAGQVEQAIETTIRWIAHDPLNEAACRRLMQLHWLTGNRAAALQVYEQFRRALADELQAEPEADTIALTQRIRSATTEAIAPSGSALPAPPALGDLPFVGRAAEHQHLVASYQAAVQGRPLAVCLWGEAGIGKTRLSQAFLEWAAVQGADILRGRALEAGGQLPYQPLVEALRKRLEPENAPEDLLPDVWLAELSQLLPELRERYPDLPALAQGDANLSRARLFEAAARLLDAWAARRPIVLFIDDLHWADAATLDLLPYLAARWAEGASRQLFLFTLREEALFTEPRLRDWLFKMERDASLIRRQLLPLTAEATAEMVQTLASGGEAAAREFGNWLFAETSGQPFFMAETLKMLIEQNILPAAQAAGGQWGVNFSAARVHLRGPRRWPMPPSLREVILTRFARLSEMARNLLAAGAVLGRASNYERLCQVSGIEELGGLPALDELTRSRLLLETGDARYPYAFAHDKIRDVAYTEAGDARRRIYHRRALATLQADAAPAAELAHHALAARLFEPAFRYSVAAADGAAAVYALAEAIEHYRRAQGLARQDGTSVGGDVLTQLYLRLGRSLELTAQHVQALVEYEELERLATQQGDRAMELAALMAQISPLATVTAAFDPARAEALTTRALPLAQALGDQAAEAKILWNLLVLYRNINRLPEAIAAGERTLALARRLDLRQELPFVLLDLGYCFSFMADFKQAGDLFREAGEHWREAGNLPMLADSLTGACLVDVFTGDYDAAIACYHEALHIAQTINSVWALAGCRHNIGYVYAERGQVAEAIAVMEESIRLSEQVSFISPLIVVRADLASLYGALGAFERAMETIRLALDVAEAKMPIFHVYALSTLARLHLWQGQIAQAEAVIEQMRTDPDREGYGIYPMLTLLAQGELALAWGNHPQAEAAAELASATLKQMGIRALLPQALYLLGRARWGLGRSGAACEALREAIHESEVVGSRLTLWRILRSLSQFEPDPAEAQRLSNQAREIIDYIAGKAPPELQAGFRSLLEVKAT